MFAFLMNCSIYFPVFLQNIKKWGMDQDFCTVNLTKTNRKLYLTVKEKQNIQKKNIFQ